jgi:O-antigen/teichoic acid export membrane protein
VSDPQFHEEPGVKVQPPAGGGRMLRNVFSNWVATAAMALLGFFMAPIVVRGLGDAAYGSWVLLNSLVGYLGLLDLGVRSAVTRYIARSHTTGDNATARGITSTALAVFGATALACLLVSVGVAWHIERFFNLPLELQADAKVAAIIAGATIAASLLSGVFGGIVVGVQRFDLSNAAEVAIGLLRAAAVLWALNAGGGLVGVAAAQLFAALLRLAIEIALAYRLYPAAVLPLARPSSRWLRLILTFGLANFLLQLSGQITLYSDSVIIGAILPVGMVTYFAIAGNLASYTRSIIGGISYVIFPLASALDARGDRPGVVDTLLRGGRVATLVVLPVACTFLVRGAEFIDLWMGPSYGPRSGPVLQVLAFSIALQPGFSILTVVMTALDRHRPLIPLFLLEMLANIAISIALVRWIGILGSALGTLIPQLVTRLWAGPWYVKRVFGVAPAIYLRDVYLRTWVSILPFCLASLLVKVVWPPNGLALYFAQVILLLPVAVWGAWLLALDAQDRHRAVRSLARFLPPLVRIVSG